MKICLIGSSRFITEYRQANEALTLAGHVVYSIAAVSTSLHGELPKEQKETLDLVHLRKIQESDCVFIVTDESKYIGESTRRELKWAEMLGKCIYSKKDENWLLASLSDPESYLLDFGSRGQSAQGVIRGG